VRLLLRHAGRLVRPVRTQDDYVPTGFKPDGTKTFAVKGYLFRLNPSIEDQESANWVSEELIEPEYPSRKQR